MLVNAFKWVAPWYYVPKCPCTTGLLWTNGIANFGIQNYSVATCNIIFSHVLNTIHVVMEPGWLTWEVYTFRTGPYVALRDNTCTCIHPML